MSRTALCGQRRLPNLNAQAWDAREVGVKSNQRQPVLPGEGRDPHIVLLDGGALGSQVRADGGVHECRICAQMEHTAEIPQTQEVVQVEVLRARVLLSIQVCAGIPLAQDNGRQVDCRGRRYST